MSYDIEKLLNSNKKFYRMSADQAYFNYRRTKMNGSGFSGEGESRLPKFTLEEVTQDQFMLELMPQSHKVNDPAYRVNTPVTADGLPFRRGVEGNEIVDWKQRARVAVPKQLTVAEKQRVHLIGNQFDFDLFKGNAEIFKNFKKYWKAYQIHAGISQVVKSALTTGDGAIYFYIDDNKDIKYDVWSYKYGNNVSYHKKRDSRKECITRYYLETTDMGSSIEVVEVYDDTYKWTYKRKGKGSVGFTQFGKDAHGFTVIPVAYNKLDDVAWGPAQNLIEQIESSLSDLRESNEYFQFQILFLKGGKIKVLPNASKQGKVIEGDADSDAKQIEPQSKPDSFVLEINTLTDSLNDSVGVVDVDTEALKGDTSGAYVKSIYFPATSYALNQIPFWTKFFDSCIKIFTIAVGKVEGKISDYKELKVMHELKPFVPQNDYEQAQILQYLRSAGAISKQTAAEVHVYSTPDEYAKIEEEENEAYERSFTTGSINEGGGVGAAGQELD